MGKKILFVAISIVTFCSVFLSPLVYANESASCETSSFVENASLDVLAKYNEDLKGQEVINPALTKKAHDANVARIKELEELEAAQLKEMFATKTVEASSLPEVTIGTDKTFTTANDGSMDGTKSGYAQYKVAYSEYYKTAESKTWSVGYGESDGYAYVGQRFIAKGNAAKNAYIRFQGSYQGQMLSGWNGEATAEVKVKVWDATVGSWVGTKTVMTESSTNNIAKYPRGSINHSILVNMQPNHEYYPYIHVVTTTNMWGAFSAKSDFYNGTDEDNDMIKYTTITVDF